MNKPQARMPFQPTHTAKSGLYVFTDGPDGPTSVSMKGCQDIPPFVERLISIGRKNIKVGASAQTAVSYEIWAAGVALATKAEERGSNA